MCLTRGEMCADVLAHTRAMNAVTIDVDTGLLAIKHSLLIPSFFPCLTRGEMCAEVCAHTRAINAVTIDVDTGLLATASEDTFAHVWHLTPR
jgi:hypothetical protein